MFTRLRHDRRVYNAVQFAAGVAVIRRWLTPRIALLAPGTIVDVGAGTGLFTDLVPDTNVYTAVDLDAERLERLSERFPRAATVVGDARFLPFPDASFDFAMCLAVAHHLPEINPLLTELRRVTRKHVLLWEPVKTTRLASRALWSIDQGDWPRTREQLLDAFGQHFAVRYVDDFALFHSYLLLEGDAAST